MTGPAQLLGARAVRELLQRHGVRPSKALGQHFVVDPNTIRKVVSLARLEPSDTVVEIGAGTGSLTIALAASAARVVALEVDARLLPVLDESVGGRDNVTLCHADALRCDLGALGGSVLVGNLPYNIAASVVLQALEQGPDIARLTVMTQREVGERLGASPGTKAYGATSVLVGSLAHADVVARIARNAFFPVPRVDSVVVRLRRRQRPGDIALLRPVVRAAFSQRRKNLRNSLASLAGGPREAEAALADAGLDPRARAETLTVEDFLRLARVLDSSRTAVPPR